MIFGNTGLNFSLHFIFQKNIILFLQQQQKKTRLNCYSNCLGALLDPVVLKGLSAVLRSGENS